MLNYLWAIMIIIGIVYGIATGNVEAVNDGLINGGGEAITLGITMLGIMALWMGLMNIATQSGLTDAVRRKLTPLIRWLFPGVPNGSGTQNDIALNMVANLLGLGWAATPAGLKAMEGLARIQDLDAGKHIDTASDDMCTFLVINISSIQLIPVNIIAYRARYGSVSPTAIILPGLIATFISTLAGVIFCRIKMRR